MPTSDTGCHLERRCDKLEPEPMRTWRGLVAMSANDPEQTSRRAQLETGEFVNPGRRGP